MEKPAQIRAAAVQNLPLAIMGQMPSTSASRKQVQRQRRKENNALASPPTRAEIVFTEQYMNREFNGHQERFLLADSGGEERILIFGSEASAGWSNQMEHIFMDGTFSVCPSLFHQLFIILSKRGGFVFPVLFCLLPDKTEQTYTRLFTLIKEIWPMFNPTSISCDFERAIHNSIRTCFPESSIFCCFFHLRQNLRKHISQSNLLNLYNNDPDFALKCKMIISLAFVPENDVINALNVLENELDDRFEPLISWFVSTYIGRIRCNGTRANPIFLYHFGMFTLVLFLIFIAQIITPKLVIAKLNVHLVCPTPHFGCFCTHLKIFWHLLTLILSYMLLVMNRLANVQNT
uniref:MULE transposase domain-containing protein n=1 Tax=Meloidogyne incognita TaxID=6306 RepID=A0A914NDU9_MELIC